MTDEVKLGKRATHIWQTDFSLSLLNPQIQTIRSKLEPKKAVKKHLADNALRLESAEFYVCRLIPCPFLSLSTPRPQPSFVVWDPIGNKSAHVAGLYGLSWPCNFLLLCG